MPSNLAYHGSDADYFANHAEKGTWNAYVDRPAMLNLIGKVAGERILDAGCGAGHYAAALVERAVRPCWASRVVLSWLPGPGSVTVPKSGSTI